MKSLASGNLGSKFLRELALDAGVWGRPVAEGRLLTGGRQQRIQRLHTGLCAGLAVLLVVAIWATGNSIDSAAGSSSLEDTDSRAYHVVKLDPPTGRARQKLPLPGSNGAAGGEGGEGVVAVIKGTEGKQQQQHASLLSEGQDPQDSPNLGTEAAGAAVSDATFSSSSSSSREEQAQSGTVTLLQGPSAQSASSAVQPQPNASMDSAAVLEVGGGNSSSLGGGTPR